jgi:hypothetical protein
VANLLVDGLAVFEENPNHRRAKLLRPTPQGREALRVISEAQQRWADELGAGSVRTSSNAPASSWPTSSEPSRRADFQASRIDRYRRSPFHIVAGELRDANIPGRSGCWV